MQEAEVLSDSPKLEEISKIVDLFRVYCESNDYQFKAKAEPNFIRLEASNGISSPIIVNIYYKSKAIVIQGKSSPLKKEMEKVKQEIESNGSSKDDAIKRIYSGNMSYTIIQPDLKNRVKLSLEELGSEIKIEDNPDSSIEYRAKVTKNGSSLTITQYNSGKLSIQGKSDFLFHELCDQIETIINSPQKEVTTRFFKGIDEHKEIIDIQKSLDYINKAENDIGEKLEGAFDFLDMHDRKLIVASRCLCLSGIILPEYTPLVMPASKAFEGYTKRIIIKLGLISEDDLKRKKGINFKVLVDNSEERTKICEKHKEVNETLRRLSECITVNRHYMMHSGDSTLHNIQNSTHAEDKVNSICTDIRETFKYLNSLGFI